MASETKRQNSGSRIPVALPKSELTAHATTPTVALDVALKEAIGARVRLNTTSLTSPVVEGTVFTADPITNLIVLNTTPPPPPAANTTATLTSALPAFTPGAYRILPLSTITSFQLVTLPPPPPPSSATTNNTATSAASTSSPSPSPSPSSPLPATAALPELQTSLLRARESRAVAAAKSAEARRGPPGTTADAQAIFDALSRSLPARWDAATVRMIISDSVAIERPYTAENCRLLASSGGSTTGNNSTTAAHQGLERIKKVLEMERAKISLRKGTGVVVAGNVVAAAPLADSAAVTASVKGGAGRLPATGKESVEIAGAGGGGGGARKGG